MTDDLSAAHLSARAALSAHRAASGWPEAPRPVHSDDLLPERVLAGDGHARRHLVDEVYLPLTEAKGTLIDTLSAYFESGSSMEATARALFVHPNTVRYRLRQTADLTGYSASDAATCADPADGAGAGSSVGPADGPPRLNSAVTVLCRVPTKNGPASYVSAGGEVSASCSAEWSPCSSSSRPGRAPRRPAS